MNVRSIRTRLTFANVASSIALFIALGGTSYALTLPHNSVGSKQLRDGAVRSPDIRNGAVRSADIRNRSVEVRDLTLNTRSALRGTTGPPGPQGEPGPTYYVEVNSGGGRTSGSGDVTHRAANEYSIVFSRSVRSCALVAGLADVKGGVTDATPDSTVIAAHDGDNAIVRTYKAGTAQPLPFALIAAC